VLRITRSIRDGTVWLKLEGKLAADWVEECRSACAAEAAQGRSPMLDLSDVTFVDRNGMQLLAQLTQAGLSIPLRSSFVAELLRLEE
jgi:anti-anti-sigma regulatory factor